MLNISVFYYVWSQFRKNSNRGRNSVFTPPADRNVQRQFLDLLQEWGWAIHYIASGLCPAEGSTISPGLLCLLSGFSTKILFSFLVVSIHVYRVSQEERTKLREGVPYVKLYRYNPKHLYLKLTVTEIMAREVWNFDSCYTLTDCQIHIETGRNMWFL